MRGMVHISFLTVAFFGAVHLSPADPLPTACVRYAPVPNGTPGVNSDPGQFTHDNEDYGYTVMSLWALDPNKPDHLCLRYDISNDGEKSIELLEWEDIGIHFTDVNPKVPLSYVRPGQSRHDNAEVADTELKAFKGTTYKNRAFFTEEQISRRPMQETTFENQESPQFAIAENYVADFDYNTKTSMPAFAEALTGAGLDFKTSISLQTPAEQITYTTLSTSFGDGSTAIRYDSVASYKDGVFEITNTIYNEGGKDADIYNPVGIALWKYGDRGSEHSDFSLLVKLFYEYKGTPITLEGDKAVRVQTYKQNPLFPALFIVEHPVTVGTGNHITCITISSYSLFPVSFGRDLCNDANAQ